MHCWKGHDSFFRLTSIWTNLHTCLGHDGSSTCLVGSPFHSEKLITLLCCICRHSEKLISSINNEKERPVLKKKKITHFYHHRNHGHLLYRIVTYNMNVHDDSAKSEQDAVDVSRWVETPLLLVHTVIIVWTWCGFVVKAVAGDPRGTEFEPRWPLS